MEKIYFFAGGLLQTDFARLVVGGNDAHNKQEASTKGETMTGIILSIILILGMADGPTDSGDSCGVTSSVEVTQKVKK